MITKEDLRQIAPFLWEIPKNYRSDMLVPARVFASPKIFDDLLKDNSLEQLINVCALPGIQKAAYAMPDIHKGYAFPIGTVAATDYPHGVISPGGIGYDINCGVRLLKTTLKKQALNHHQGFLAKRLFEEIPSGAGHKRRLITLGSSELDGVLETGALWMIKQGYGQSSDLTFLESEGRLENAAPYAVSTFAKERGKDQLGTIGSGNHFVEAGYVDEIFDKKTAKVFGLFQDQVVVLIHTGSRGLGHQTGADYIQIMLKSLPKFGIILPDPQLACAPLSSSEGTSYFSAMAAAANFAWANRQLITDKVRKVFKEIFGEDLMILYDVAHNIAKIEEHEINGQIKQIIVHRKGATRAFPNQPVIIPGSMGSASYVLVGAAESMKQAFGSSCHGAGRRMSRHAAAKAISGRELKKDLERQGVYIQAGSIKGLSEEAPLAYKDIDEVIGIIDKVQIAKKVARLKPVVVIKG